MLISHSKKFIFLEVPRTASRSMGISLSSIAGENYQQYPHHTMEIPEEFQGYFTFTCVRNPYSREVSHYLYRSRNKKNNMYKFVSKWSFLEYVKWASNPNLSPIETHDFPQSDLLANKRLDKILRFENLPDDFYRLPFVDISVKFLKKNNNPPVVWQSFYSEDIADIVYQWAERDFFSYGYDKDSWCQPVSMNHKKLMVSRFTWHVGDVIMRNRIGKWIVRKISGYP